MAVTTGWMWGSINRNRDYTIAGTIEYFRENWQLTRFRVSDAAYSSELGDTATSLAAVNGGVTETITPPVFNALKIEDSTDVALSWNGLVTLPYEDYDFYELPWEWNGQKAYGGNKNCQQDSSAGLSQAIDPTYFPIIMHDAVLATDWIMVAEPESVLQSGQLSYADAAAYVTAKFQIMAYSSDGAGSPIHAGAVDFVDTTIPFRCTGDAQTYDQPSVDWYRQTQTWIARSPWA